MQRTHPRSLQTLYLKPASSPTPLPSLRCAVLDLQYHYPAIAPIIKEVCKEHGVEYIHLDTFREAFTAHIAHLRNMGQEVSHFFVLRHPSLTRIFVSVSFVWG